MPNIQNSDAFRLVAFLSCAVTAACSGGGGGGTGPASAASTPASSVVPTTTTSTTPTFCSTCVGPPSMGANYDTGIAAGPIAAPAPASFGSAPAQIATSATPTFDKSSGSYPVNVIFPLISTSLKSASPGMSATASPDATLTVNSATPTNFQLVIPSINVNANFTSIENIVANTSGWTWGYSYVAVGSWRTASGNSGPLQSDTFYSFGYETPGSGMPTTGAAQFAGPASGNVYQINNATILSTEVDGKANVSVNFSSGQVTGSLTQMQQWDGTLQRSSRLSAMERCVLERKHCSRNKQVQRHHRSDICSWDKFQHGGFGNRSHRRSLIRADGAKSRGCMVLERWIEVRDRCASGQAVMTLDMPQAALSTTTGMA